MILVLFDIDLTLVDIMEFHRKVVRDIFKEFFGIEANIYSVRPYGKTVLQVIKELCNKYRIVCNYDLLKEEWEKRIKNNLQKKDIEILPGVHEILEELKNRVTLGIITGNTEEVGKTILERAGLLKYFTVFGFNENESDRSKILERVLEKNPGYEKVVVIGDSPRDILAAKKENVLVIGVATGVYSEKDLKEYGADLVVPDLKHGKNKILEFIFS